MSLLSAAPRRLWLIGGTQESARLARSLAAEQIPCWITITTEAARALYPLSPHLHIWVGRLAAEMLPAWIQTHAIVAILDASHPFATEISQSAIAVATQLALPYLRFERPGMALPEADGTHPDPAKESGPGAAVGKEWTGSSAAHLTFSSFQSLLATEVLLGQRVLLTVGYRPLVWFQPWQGQATLFARILPSVTALQAAIAAGFTPDRLIALRPPVTAPVEQALWHQWQISVVVTKASGAAGGEDVKRAVATALGVQLITIARPDLVYPQQTADLAIALQFCQQHL